jgi:membrane associated rhomboid family serine protease
VAAALAQAAFDPLGTTAMLGASGAIGGVLAAYVSLHPGRRIDTLFFVFVLPIPALFFVLEWFVMNLFRGLGTLAVAEAGGVAWWAHVGGFVAGLLLVRLLFPREQAQHSVAARAREVEVFGPHGERYTVRNFRSAPPDELDEVARRRMPYGDEAWPNR